MQSLNRASEMRCVPPTLSGENALHLCTCLFISHLAALPPRDVFEDASIQYVLKDVETGTAKTNRMIVEHIAAFLQKVTHAGTKGRLTDLNEQIRRIIILGVTGMEELPEGVLKDIAKAIKQPLRSVKRVHQATWGASTAPSLRPVPVLLCWSCCLTAAVRYEVLAMICCMPQLPAAHCVYFHGIQRQFIAQYNIGPPSCIATNCCCIECMLFPIQMPVHPTAAKSEVLR